MRVWYFSEMAYHPAWEEGLKRGSLRVVLPNAHYDPKGTKALPNAPDVATRLKPGDTFRAPAMLQLHPKAQVREPVPVGA